jgi:hypothetical protein
MKLGTTLARLHREQTGNVYVLFIAAALLFVALLWAVIGVGQRVVQHQTLQSSADAAAYSAAVMRAKGLNLVAFCNLLLAALFALIVAHRLFVAALIAAGISANIAGNFDARVTNAMQSVWQMERAMNALWPAIALAESAATGSHKQYRRNYGAGRLLSVTWPMPKQPLAVEPTLDIPFGGLCDRANAVYASDLARMGAWPSPPDYSLLRTKTICDFQLLFPPLVLPPNWDSAKLVHGYSLLEDANVNARRRSTSVAATSKAAAPTASRLLTSARAEVYPAHGYVDLWHMDWRARLIEYAPGDLSDRDPAGAIPAADVQAVAGAVKSVEGSRAYGVLSEQFLAH